MDKRIYQDSRPTLIFSKTGPNTGIKVGQRYECIKSLEHHKRQKILQTDRSSVFCFMFSLDKYSLL